MRAYASGDHEQREGREADPTNAARELRPRIRGANGQIVPPRGGVYLDCNGAGTAEADREMPSVTGGEADAASLDASVQVVAVVHAKRDAVYLGRDESA